MAKLDFQIPPDLAANSKRRSQHGGDPIFRIILGIAIVAAGVYVGNILYTRYMIHEANKALMEMGNELNATLQVQTERARQHQLAIEHERTLRKQMELDAQRKQTERQIAAQQEAQRKEAAWSKFYKPAAMCENPLTQAAIVECGNRHIRERRKFEEMWTKSQDRLIIN